MDKLGRNYVLTLMPPALPPLTLASPVVVTLPFTLEFDITRNMLTSANVCQLRIYNLSADVRNMIRFNISNFGQNWPLVLQAGYGDNLASLPVVFQGNVSQAWSVREGTNFITQIECFDGGFAFQTGQTNLEFPSGTTTEAIIAAMAGSLPSVTLGGIGSYPGTLARGNSYSGNTCDLLSELTGGGFFIDQGYANALGTDEYIASPNEVTINAKTGLLGTPVLEQQIVRFDMLFEPSLNVGYQATLASATEVNYNGPCKITAVKHRGMISGAVCGQVVTTGEFFFLPAGVAVQGGAA